MTRHIQDRPCGNRPAVAVKTLGCRLNQAETAIITGRFVAAGYTPVVFGQRCDVAIIHGCVITGRAESDSLQSVRQARRANPDAVVVLAGCPGETLPAPARDGAGADLVVGQQAKLELPRLLHKFDPQRFPKADSAERPPDPHVDTRRAYIKIQDGCDFGCAYCIVPAARGRPRSRPLPEIVGEISRLADAGFREMVLAGANIGCYASGQDTLADLLRAVVAIRGVGRFRLGSIEPGTAERFVADFMRESPAICRFLHLPLQSGDDRILAAMGRRYDVSAYRRAVDHVLDRVPEIGLGTDVIVGFPGEDDTAFGQTVRLVEAIPFSNLHVFPYSRRPGTRAYAMPGQVPDKVRQERARVLRDLAADKRRRFATTFVGRTVRVLVERTDSAGWARGWTAEYLDAAVHAPDARPGDLIDFTPAEAADGVLRAPPERKTEKKKCCTRRADSRIFSGKVG